MPKLVMPIKWAGGKHYLIKDINKLVDPECTTFVEPCLGSARWLYSRIVTDLKADLDGRYYYGFDINDDLINFYNVCKYHNLELIDKVRDIKYSREAFDWAENYDAELAEADGTHFYDKDMHVTAAAKFLVRNRMSRDGMFTSYGWSDRERRKMPENVSSYLNVVENLLYFCKMSYAHFDTIEVFDALQMGLFKNNSHCCTYLDPPYPLKTRPSKKLYGKFEVARTEEEDHTWHETLLDLVLNIKGQVIISSYDNELYNTKLKGWRRVDIPIKVKMGGTKKDDHKGQRIEVIYSNR